jgi:ABC-type sugar transport system ATPase subunit
VTLPSNGSGSSQTGVTLDGVRVEREGRVVLDVRELAFTAGRTTAVLGPNGSGKTTLLRAIAGLEPVREGRVAIGGQPAATRRDVGYVFQEEVFLRESVRWNLELGLHLRRVGSLERRRRIDEAAALVGVADLLERRADRLSGGEGRRVSLARALCLRAPVVLLDEPLAGLDEHAYARLIGELPRIVAAFQATTILVTHSRDEALRLASDLVVLVNGQVLAAGELRAVAANPRVVAVAEVLGYAVLASAAGPIAVPPGGLRVGPGQPEFTMTVDRILELMGVTELIGRVDGIVVRIPVAGATPRPGEGDHITVHAARFSALSETGLRSGAFD